MNTEIMKYEGAIEEHFFEGQNGQVRYGGFVATADNERYERKIQFQVRGDFNCNALRTLMAGMKVRCSYDVSSRSNVSDKDGKTYWRTVASCIRLEVEQNGQWLRVFPEVQQAYQPQPTGYMTPEEMQRVQHAQEILNQ